MSTAVIFIDIQEKFTERLDNKEKYLKKVYNFAAGIRPTDLPVFHIHSVAGGKSMLTIGCDDETVIKQGYDSFIKTGLEVIIQEYGLKSVIIAGLYTHVCVQSLAMGFHDRGIKVTLVKDCLDSDRLNHASHALAWMKEKFADVMDSDEVINLHSSIPLRLTLLRQLIEENKQVLMNTMAQEIHKDFELGDEEITRSIKSIQGALKSYNQFQWNVKHVKVRNVPYKNVMVITPYNNPIAIAVKKIAPALLGGNKVVWKASNLAMKTTEKLKELIDKAGLSSLVSLYFGYGPTCNKLLDKHNIKMVSFTGSTRYGNEMKEICESKGIVFQGEMGTQNTAIITDTCDLTDAASALKKDCFDFAGQRCTGTRIIIVENTVKQLFIDLFLGMCKVVSAGQMVNEERANMLASKIEKVIQKGDVHFLLGGKVRKENWMEYTLLLADDEDNAFMNMELFGPVALIIGYDDIFDAVRIANKSDFQLMSTIYSNSAKEIEIFTDDVESSILRINPHFEEGLNMDAPFGGWGKSSSGLPENGYYDILTYTKPQVIYGLTEETFGD